VTHDSCTGRYCKAHISYENSVRLSVCLSWPGTDLSLGQIETPGLHHMIALVSYEKIWSRWVRRFPSNVGIKEGYPPKSLFTTIGSSSMKMVADIYRLAAYHNKHCQRTFQWYQHRWPWTTLNPKNRGFGEFFTISCRDTPFKSEFQRNHSR